MVLLEDLPEARIDSCVLADELANLPSRRLLFGPPIGRTGNASDERGNGQTKYAGEQSLCSAQRRVVGRERLQQQDETRSRSGDEPANMGRIEIPGIRNPSISVMPEKAAVAQKIIHTEVTRMQSPALIQKKYEEGAIDSENGARCATRDCPVSLGYRDSKLPVRPLLK